MDRDFAALVGEQWAGGKRLCVGLDIVPEQLPPSLRKLPFAKAAPLFSAAIVEAVGEYAAAFKPNIAYFEAFGGEGLTALKRIIAHIHRALPEVPVIVDAKRADIAHTNMGYVAHIFYDLEADATTLNPYLGEDALAPFLQMQGKGLFMLCRTSNAGSAEFQDLPLANGTPLYAHVARRVAEHWQARSAATLGLVMGATHAAALAKVRDITADTPLLLPGIGAQGADVQELPASCHHNSLFNVSRQLIYAFNKSTNTGTYQTAIAESAKQLHASLAKHSTALNTP